jgi:hypothetical protein
MNHPAIIFFIVMEGCNVYFWDRIDCKGSMV